MKENRMILKLALIPLFLLLFFCFEDESKIEFFAKEKLKDFYFNYGATASSLPASKEKLFGPVKSIKSSFIKAGYEGENNVFQISYYDKNLRIIKLESIKMGNPDTLRWYRLFEYYENEKSESFYKGGKLIEKHRWVYMPEKGLIAHIEDSLGIKFDTADFARLNVKKGIIESTPYKEFNTFSTFFHYNQNGEIDYWGHYAFKKGSETEVDFKSLNKSIRLKKKFDKNGCYCEQNYLVKPNNGKTKFQNDKFCNRIRFGNSYNFNSYEYDGKNNWIKRYEISDKNPKKLDTLVIEVREIEYYK
jgi:hypothetical protein